MGVVRDVVTVACLAACLGACAFRADRGDVRLPSAAATSARPAGPVQNWPHPADVLERELAYAEATVHSSKPAGAGVTGAFVQVVCLGPHKGVHKVKWKEVPHGDADGWNNSPRKELAAYAIQKWFLDPKDYVVPTTVARCIPIDHYRTIYPGATPSIMGTSCALGVASTWLQHVRVPDRLYGETRFGTDCSYAYHVANFNILTYLIDHRDGRGGNFLVSTDPANRRVYAVDNGISFGTKVYNYFVRNWNDIRVPALPHTAVDRLRRVTRSDLERLGVVLEMRADDDGILRPADAGPNLDPSEGARLAPGRIQLGLTEAEIEDVGERLRRLLEEVEAGELPTF